MTVPFPSPAGVAVTVDTLCGLDQSAAVVIPGEWVLEGQLLQIFRIGYMSSCMFILSHQYIIRKNAFMLILLIAAKIIVKTSV